MAPEYAMGGRFSEKSDVFSFGVLVLEIISGRRNTSFYNDEFSLGLLGYVSMLRMIIRSSLLLSVLDLTRFSCFPFRHGSCGMKKSWMILLIRVYLVQV